MPDWNWAGGQTSGGRVDAVYNHPSIPNHYVIGTYTSGIFVSTNGGTSWNCVTDNLSFPVFGVKQIIADPNNANHLLAITGTRFIEGGVIYSNDAGQNWYESQTGLPQFQSLDYHPTEPNLVFGAANTGIYYSNDNGLTWTSLGLPPTYDPTNKDILQLLVLENKFYFGGINKYVSGAELFSGDFSVSVANVSVNSWSIELSSAFIPGETLSNVAFSNKVGSNCFIQLTGSSDHTFKSIDFGVTFANILNDVPSGGIHTYELIASPNDPNILYVAEVWAVRKYDLNNGTNVVIGGLSGNSGHHVDYRASQIIDDVANDRIIFGNDGGIGLVPNGLSQTATIQSLYGDLSISMIHAFDVHEKTGRIAYGFQDHAMRYRDPGNIFSPYFIWEGSAAMIQQHHHEAIVGENAYNGIKDRETTSRDLIAGVFGEPGECYLGGYFIKYRHFPDRFARGMNKSSSYPTGKVGMGRAIQDQERSIISDSKGIGPVAFCERKPEFVYAADNERGVATDKFYRSADDGVTWENMNYATVILDGNNTNPVNLSDYLIWNNIRAIAVDHHDPILVYCGIGGTHTTWPNGITDERFRVIRSFDGGETFDDYSEGLPALPVERLLTIDSDNDLIFCATSVGIYYRTNDMNRWECFSEGLPKAQVTGLQYIYCDNVLYASTYGRGMWKTDVNLPISSNFTQEITQNTVWAEDRTLTENLVVKQGYTLIIQGDVYIEANKKIIVEDGAKLVVDGAKLTNYCGTYWNGIELWGNSNLTQSPTNQGILETKNGAVIEYARSAINTLKVNGISIDWSKTGGIVKCTNTTFRNNARSCQYLYYHSQHPFIAGVEIPNQGRFVDCEFIWDDEVLPGPISPAVTMFHVNGVQFAGCTFEDLRTGVTVNDRASGIFSLDAGFKVRGRDLGAPTPFPIAPLHWFDVAQTDYKENLFKDLRYGIHVMNYGTFSSVVVDQSRFLNNSYGVQLDAVDDAIITRNWFEFNDQAPAGMTAMYELSFRESNAYKVEGNDFKKVSNPWGAAGTLVENSGPSSNEVYRNRYDGVNVGNWGRGFNSNDQSNLAGSTGLQWLCNENANGYFDLLNNIPFYDPSLNGEGVRLLQGNPETSAGNKFSTSITPGGPDRHLYHEDQDLMGYYYSPFDLQEFPTEVTGLVTYDDAVFENQCASSFVSTIYINSSNFLNASALSAIQTRLNTINQEVALKTAELEALILAGDDASLHALVQNLNNSNKNDVKNILLEESPYLSMSLLEELGLKQPSLFPHSWYKKIIDSNIEVARDESFMEFLSTKPYPLPIGMYNQIKENRFFEFTERGEKELVILTLNDEREVLMNLLISDAMAGDDEVNWNDVKQLIINRDHLECKRQVVDYHMGREEISSCCTILDLLELELASYKMERVKQELEDFIFFKRYLLSITVNTGIVKKLQTAEIAQLEYMADNFEGKAKRQARNILCFYEGMCEEIDYEIPAETSNGNKSMGPSQWKVDENAPLQELTIVPNPNNGEFLLGVPEGCSIETVSIVDITGRQINYEEISSKGNETNIRLLNAEKGVHIIVVNCLNGTSYMNRVLVAQD